MGQGVELGHLDVAQNGTMSIPTPPPSDSGTITGVEMGASIIGGVGILQTVRGWGLGVGGSGWVDAVG